MTTETRDLFNKLHEDRVDSARTLEKRSMRGLKASVVDKYSDQAHFIYELIQNADDVGATFVSFSLYNDRLEFVHNGKRHFNITDVDNETEDSNNGTLGDLNAITSIANSNKTDASIGKFGVGFKAVFQYTNEPRIYDPLVSFKIERFIVPVLIEDDYEGRKPDETVFVFPFNHSERPASVAFEDILYKMQNLVFPTLFLNNLKTIYYKCDSKSISGVYRKDTIKSCVVDDVIAEKLELTNGMDSKTKRLIIDAANVQSYSLRVKVKHDDSLADIDYESINSINITAKSPAFLTQSLIEEFGKFANPPYEFDDDYDMQGNLCENISFIFGPPGTGKTTYLSNNTLIPLVRQNDKVRILVLAPTNKAADVLVSKIMDSMGKDHSYEKWLVRYGITSDEKIEESPVFKGKDFEIEDYKKCVIVTTMARLPYDYFIDSKGNFNFLHGINWDYIVVDEASMIPLVYMVYMLYLKTPKQFIIAGDPFQIEPTTSVSEWKSENIYKMVHLEDFSENAETVPYRYDIKLLTTQYRSIEDVGDVFSRFTYKGIVRRHDVSENESNDIEDTLFGNEHYIEDNAFSTGHQLVNVYGMPERRYEVRSEDTALDVQVHGKSKYVELNEEIPEAVDEDPIQAPERHTKPIVVPQSKPQASSYQPARTQPQSQPQVISPSKSSVISKPNTVDTMSVNDYRKQFPVGCRIEYRGLGKGTVVMNQGNYFVVDFDTQGKKPLNPSNCMNFQLITRCNDEQQ